MYTYGTSCSAYISGNPSFYYTNSNVSTNTFQQLFGKEPTGLYIGDPSSFNSCTFDLITSNISGTTPTLNVYIQNQNETVNPLNDDRISFTQATTGTAYQEATILLNSSSVPHVLISKSLAAGTMATGKFTDEINLAWTVGGTSPAYSLSIVGHCQ